MFLLLFSPVLQMLSSKDINFVGYTYKNFEIVNDHQLPEIGMYLPLSADACICLIFLLELLYSFYFLSLISRVPNALFRIFLLNFVSVCISFIQFGLWPKTAVIIYVLIMPDMS